MAVQRRTSFISQQRVDVPDMRAIESAASNDFDQLIQAMVTGTGQGYFLRGFEILMSGAIGGAASGLQVLVDPGAVLHIASSQSGTVYMVPTGTAPQQLNSATNTIVQGAFAPSAVNYVGIEYERYLDSTTDAEVYLWDPVANDETTTIVPRAQILDYNFIITTTVWASNVLPLAIVVTDAGNNVVSITDCRWNLFSLGTGGASPNLFYRYPWTAESEGRTPNPSTSNSNSVNPFHGGDKMLGSFKDWMNAVMTMFLEINGGTYWTSPSTAGSLSSLREDLGNTILTGNSNVAHGVLPNSVPVLTTTGNTNSSNQLTNLGSTTGIVDGQVVLGSGIPTGTTVIGVSGTTVTLSQNATTTATGVTVSFYTANVVTQPGQINWASNPPGVGELYLRLVGSRLSYQIAENPSGASVTLANNQVAYLNLNRGVSIVPNLVFTPNSGPNTTTVSSVGAIAWTGPLQVGDFVRQASDTDAFYYQIQSVDSLTQVTLTGQYVIPGMTASGVPAVYAWGVYTLPGQTSTARDMVIANREAVPMGQNVVWLFLRSDDSGSIPRVYVKFLGAELQQGDSQEISGPTLSNVLQYIGSPTESATLPNYTSAVYPGALPQISTITVGPTSSMTAGQYFLINSAGNYRQSYVWVKINGVGTDPAPANTNDSIVWNVATGNTAQQNANLLTVALNSASPNDFHAVQQTSPNYNVVVTNTSAGTTVAPANINVGGLTIVSNQAGTGIANSVINDGDNLTVALKKLDEAIGNILQSANTPSYEETVSIVASGATPPSSINGPVSPSTVIALPNNSRYGSLPQKYTVGKGQLEVYLNGQRLNVSSGTGGSGVFQSYGMSGSTTSDVNLVSGASEYAVAFTPSSNISLTDVSFIVAVISSAAVGNLYSRVETDSSGVPSGTVLGTSSTVAASTVTSTPAAIDFNYSTPVSLTAGVTYWFTITGDSTYLAGSNHIDVQHPVGSATPYGFAYWNGSVWTSLPNPTPCFSLAGTTSASTRDWSEIGTAGAQSSTIQTNISLVVGDLLTFRINAGAGGGGGGGGGTQGPPGPAGPQGPAGVDQAGGPVAISTKVSNYTVMIGDNFLKANCATNNASITFTLPPASSATGRIFNFKKIDSSAFAMIILANGSDLIDGVSSQSTTTQWASFTLISDGATWSIF